MSSMTSKERFQTALDLGVPDRVPMFDYIDEKVALLILSSVLRRKRMRA